MTDSLHTPETSARALTPVRRAWRLIGAVVATIALTAACGDSDATPTQTGDQSSSSTVAESSSDTTAVDDTGMDDTDMDDTDMDDTGDGHSHDHGETIDLDPTIAPTLAIAIVDDPNGGHNLRLDITNFSFAPENVSTDHIDGEGHAHLYINGERITRLYTNWHQVPALPPGDHTIRVDLSANDHRTLAVNGEPISATTSLTIEGEGEAMDKDETAHDHGADDDGDGDAHDHDHGEADDATAVSTEGADVVFEVEIVDESVVGGVEQVKVDIGQTVALVVTNDADDELHLHGYDVFAAVTAGQPSVLIFEARIPGVFEAELEGRGQRVIEFEVS